jgi:hypothetical protein
VYNCGSNSTSASGVIQILSIVSPSGKYRLQIVNFSIDQSSNVSTVCTDHFPNDLVPAITTLPRCCNAHATISEAEALIQSIKITTGLSPISVYHSDLNTSSGKMLYLAVVMISFSGRKNDANSTAVGKYPPPFHLKSRMTALYCSLFSNNNSLSFVIVSSPKILTSR